MMALDDAELEYVQERVVQSLRMARAATGCARTVHEDLAARYTARLEIIVLKHREQSASSISSYGECSRVESTLVVLTPTLALPAMLQQLR